MLVACEYSGTVRDAFSRMGWDAWSCDILPTESELTVREGKHIQDDVLSVLSDGWDLMIGHPPCTYLAVSGNRHIPGNPERWKKQLDALLFVWELMNADIPYIAIENPISVISSYIRKPDQIIHPYYFGDNVPKSTCLWLKNLPLLTYSLEDDMFNKKTSVEPEYVIFKSKKNKSGISKYGVQGKIPSTNNPRNALLRSKTYPGFANAMAEQWTEYINQSTV